jgi:hypothetical protein
MEYVDRPNHLTDAQKQVLSQLKEKYPTRNEQELCRFLWRRNWDLSATIELMDKFIAWRTAIGEVTIDTIGESALRLGMCYTFGMTKLGVPVVVVRAGKVLLSQLTYEEMVRLNVFFIERVLAYTKYECYSVIFDYAGFSLSNINWSWLRDLMSMWTDYYPECSNIEYFINMPFVFRAVWSFVSPWLTPRAKACIVLCSGDYKKILREAFDDLSQLQTCYGGEAKWELDCNGPLDGCLGILGPAP